MMKPTPSWMMGTFFQLEWAVACAALVLAAAACARAEGFEPKALRAMPPKIPRSLRVGGGVSRVAYLGLVLVAARVVSLHWVAVAPGPAGMPDRKYLRQSSAADARLDLVKWNASFDAARIFRG